MFDPILITSYRNFQLLPIIYFYLTRSFPNLDHILSKFPIIISVRPDLFPILILSKFPTFANYNFCSTRSWHWYFVFIQYYDSTKVWRNVEYFSFFKNNKWMAKLIARYLARKNRSVDQCHLFLGWSLSNGISLFVVFSCLLKKRVTNYSLRGP